MLKERVALSLPSKPKVFSVNIFDLNQAKEKNEKIKYLTENSKIPVVAKEIKHEILGL